MCVCVRACLSFLRKLQPRSFGRGHMPQAPWPHLHQALHMCPRARIQPAPSPKVTQLPTFCAVANHCDNTQQEDTGSSKAPGNQVDQWSTGMQCILPDLLAAHPHLSGVMGPLRPSTSSNHAAIWSAVTSKDSPRRNMQ